MKGVVRFEVAAELEDGSFGGDGGETIRGHLGRELRAAWADEDVVGGVDAKEELGVAEGTCGAYVESALGEDASGEGAEVGGGIEDEKAGTLCSGLSVPGNAVHEGEDGLVFGRIVSDDRRHPGEVEQGCDEGW